MTAEQTAVTDPNYNPFDSDNFASGGGLWDGKTVTITSAVAKTEALAYGDGKPVVNDKGEQQWQTALYLRGIADGADEKERHEEYSVGDKLVPTPDGRGFKAKDGGPVRFHANSNMAKLSAALKASGLDLGTLVERGGDGTVTQRLDRLVGGRFVFKAFPKIGKDGKPVKDKKGYDKNIHLPVKYVGHAQGGGVAASAPSGNGGAAPSALEAKADGIVIAALGEAGGKLTRAQLIQAAAKRLQGDADSNAVVTLLVQDAYHKGKGWKYDGKEASL